MIKTTLLEFKKKKKKYRGPVPIISEPMSVTWIQVSFPTCKKRKEKDGCLFEEKKIVRN